MRLLGSAKVDYDFSDFVDGLSAAVFFSEQRQTTDERAQYYAKTSAYFVGSGPNGSGGSKLGRYKKINFLRRPLTTIKILVELI